MRHWNLPLTYQQKIDAVKKGICRQSIRFCTVSKSKKHPGQIVKKRVGDAVRFYCWTGRPYWSSPEYITKYMILVEAIDCLVRNNGIDNFAFQGEYGFWDWWELDQLANLDGIVPATGEALRDVLIAKNGRIPSEGKPAQVLRWLYK